MFGTYYAAAKALRLKLRALTFERCVTHGYALFDEWVVDPVENHTRTRKIAMHYRITKVTHEAGRRDQFIEILGQKEELISSFEGLNYVRMIAISDTVTIAISEYESEEKLKAVEGRFKEIMVDMVPLMSAPPEVLNGDSFWEKVLS